MQKWAYYWFVVLEDLNQFDSEKHKQFNNRSMNGDEFLSFLGTRGWELVSAVPRAFNGSTSVKYIFKKPIEE